MYFVCVEPGCIDRLLTNKDITSIIRVYEEHNHLPATIEIKTIKFKQELFSDTRQNPTGPLKEIYENNLDNVSDFVPPRYENLRGTLNRKRSLTLPPIPKTLDEVFIGNSWTKTLDDHNLLLHQESGIVIFVTDAGLIFFNNQKFCWGTVLLKQHPLHSYKFVLFTEPTKITKYQLFGHFLARRQKFIKKIWKL